MKKGITPKGNNKYYLSKNSEKNDLETVPEGFEVFENVHGGVFIRKYRPSILLISEKDLLESKISKYKKKVRYEEKEKSVILYCILSSILSGEDSFISLAFGSGVLDIDKFGHYMQMFRFELLDSSERLFAPYRWCIRGGREYWLSIGNLGTLNELLEEYLQHIDQDTFYELH